MPSFVLHVQVWVWPLFAALLLALDRDDDRFWWCVPIVIVWANLHASAVLAVPVVWLDFVVRAIQRRPWRARALLALAVVPAIFCTPFGWKLVAYALEPHPFFAFVYEWGPISRLSFPIAFGFIPLAALALWASIQLWRKRARDVLLALAMAVYSVLHQRNMGLFAISAMPLAAMESTGIKRSHLRTRTLHNIMLATD